MQYMIAPNAGWLRPSTTHSFSSSSLSCVSNHQRWHDILLQIIMLKVTFEATPTEFASMAKDSNLAAEWLRSLEVSKVFISVHITTYDIHFISVIHRAFDNEGQNLMVEIWKWKVIFFYRNIMIVLINGFEFVIFSK